MAKKRRKKPVSRQRDTSAITKRNRLLSRRKKKQAFRVRDFRKLNIQGDLRRYRPSIQQGLVYEDGRPVEYGLTRDKKRDTDRLRFINPKRAMVCQRRQMRRESLFALNKVGRGKRVSSNRRRTKASDIKC